ncbi:hypothetical protein [Cohnella sp. 56]|uniref:hypothetical protein n=1 Tax=Cohnella sp. 56 TaxID=3113722 RepID=UPI0030E82E4C
MTKQRRIATLVILVLAALLIGISWFENLREYKAAGLPASRFLDHRIEAGGEPGESFFLYYAANNDDKRVPIAFENDALPNLHLDPVYLYGDYGRLRLYRALASFRPVDEDAKPREEPLVVTAMKVYYANGDSAEMPIGELIVNAGAAVRSDDTAVLGTSKPAASTEPGGSASAASSLAEFASGGASSNGSGYGSFTMNESATLRSVTSAYTAVLGDAFRMEISVNGKVSPLPVAVKKGDQVKIAYAFFVTESSKLAMMPLSLRLAAELVDDQGKTQLRPVWAEHAPYPTKTALRQFAKAQRSDTP